MDIHERLNDVIFPEAVNTGGFGNDVVKVLFKANDAKGTDHFASVAVFGEITMEEKKSNLIVQPVLIKTQKRFESPSRREISNSMFFNEVLFYTKILPMLRKYDKHNILSTSIPEFVYGKATNGHNLDEDIIVLKDLRQKGFQPCINPLNLDENHFELIFDRIGKYHALSFMCREADPVGFEEITSHIKVLNFTRKFAGNISKEAFKECLFRGIDPLQKEPKYRDKLADLYSNCEKVYDNEPIDKYWADHGPFPVIIHGDFRLDNMLFKYQANSKPIEVVFFDFQTITLSSPAIDTSYILFMDTPGGVRRSRWDHLLQVYYGAWSCQMGDHREKPSFEALELDLRKKGISTYHYLALILPVLLDLKAGKIPPSPPKLDGLDKNQSQRTMEAYMQNLRERGGPDATEKLTEVVRLMIDKDFIFEP